MGVARQYCGALGKKANCQSLVSLTVARGEVPVPVALRLFLPDECSLTRSGVRRRACPRRRSCRRAKARSRSANSTACEPRASASGGAGRCRLWL